MNYKKYQKLSMIEDNTAQFGKTKKGQPDPDAAMKQPEDTDIDMDPDDNYSE